MPPCTSLELRLLVPDAQSRASSIPTRRPRVTASSADPVPTMPPPMTSTSSSFSRMLRRADSRSAGPSLFERVTDLRLAAMLQA